MTSVGLTAGTALTPRPLEEVERRRNLSAREFAVEYGRRGRPVVLEGDGFWREARAFSFDRLGELCGHRELASLHQGGGGSTNIGADLLARCRTLGEYIGLLAKEDTAQSPSAPAPKLQLPTEFGHFASVARAKATRSGLPYLHNISLGAVPELAGSFRSSPTFGRNLLFLRERSRELATGELFVAPAATGYGELHFDTNCLCVASYQLTGRKKWWLFPPSASKYLYPMPYPGDWYPNFSPIDVEDPDLSKYPRFAEATGFTTTLGPGDVLYCPPSWWHNTKNLTANVSIAVRMILASNALDVVVDMVRSGLIQRQVDRYIQRVIDR